MAFVEKDIRNAVAHNIVSIDEKKIIEQFGVNFEKIIYDFKVIAESVNIKKKNLDTFWHSYEDLNSIVIKNL